MRHISLLLLILLFSSCDTVSKTNTQSRLLSQDQAVKLAEQFVVENGYTNATRDKINKDLIYDVIERGGYEETLELRYNTLKPKAIGCKRSERWGKKMWSVAFSFVDEDPEHCRVVIMELDASNIQMSHKDGFTSYFRGFDE